MACPPLYSDDHHLHCAIKNHVLMLFLPRADLFVLLRIGKTQAFYFF